MAADGVYVREMRRLGSTPLSRVKVTFVTTMKNEALLAETLKKSQQEGRSVRVVLDGGEYDKRAAEAVKHVLDDGIQVDAANREASLEYVNDEITAAINRVLEGGLRYEETKAAAQMWELKYRALEMALVKTTSLPDGMFDSIIELAAALEDDAKNG